MYATELNIETQWDGLALAVLGTPATYLFHRLGESPTGCAQCLRTSTKFFGLDVNGNSHRIGEVTL